MDIMDLLTVTLSNMYFSFNGQVFRQKEGLPMGSNISAILAIRSWTDWKPLPSLHIYPQAPTRDMWMTFIHSQSYTLRRALSPNNKERTCTRANFPISGTKLCLLRNAVYQITCNNYNQHYIGSTTRFIHDRVREHLNNDNSSVKKHLSQCQNKVYKGIEIKSIVLENDPANLRLFEAFYIRKYKPIINSREECSEFEDLLF